MKQLITFDHSEKHNVLNLSRVDPALIISKKVGKYDMVCIRNKKKPVLCVSVVAIQDDYTATPKTIGEENILKFITATPLTQEFERFAAVLCMTHGVETARCQLLDNLLTFSTRSGELLCFCLFQFLILAAEKISGSPKKSSTPRKNLFATFQSKATTTDKTSGYSYTVSSLSAHDISENFHLCLLPTDFDFFFLSSSYHWCPGQGNQVAWGSYNHWKRFSSIWRHHSSRLSCSCGIYSWQVYGKGISQCCFPQLKLVVGSSSCSWWWCVSWNILLSFFNPPFHSRLPHFHFFDDPPFLMLEDMVWFTFGIQLLTLMHTLQLWLTQYHICLWLT